MIYIHYTLRNNCDYLQIFCLIAIYGCMLSQYDYQKLRLKFIDMDD